MIFSLFNWLSSVNLSLVNNKNYVKMLTLENSSLNIKELNKNLQQIVITK